MSVPLRPIVVSMLSALFLLAGCGEDETAQRICRSNQDCRTGLICLGGTCVPIETIDRDGDGVPNDIEEDLGTNPDDRDSDGDDIPDNEELEFDDMSQRWSAPDGDMDGIADALEAADGDADGDGVPDAQDPCDDDPNCPIEGGAHPPCLMLQDQPCPIGLGDCVAVGITVCTADGLNVVCQGDALAPSAEACDGRDNDCDGETDEDFPEVDTDCDVGVGACGVEGLWVCDEAMGVVCDAIPESPEDERCDGIDNDCDGQTDEDYPALGEDCMEGQGECSRAGIIACDPETGAATCLGPDSPEVEERCDGLDNDCDGRIDERFPNLDQACVVGQGVCANEGVIRCSMNGEGEICDGVVNDSILEETCNQLDDDCDGSVDETFRGLGSPCSVGEGTCVNDGDLVCAADGLSTVCSAQIQVAEPERCDAIDNDCDGIIDESFDLGGPCSSGRGECLVAGQNICDPVSGELRCDARPSPEQAERCDGLDNDCDGISDELFPTLGDDCEIGLGECRSVGMIACRPNGDGTICGAHPDPLAAELCDGLDNDCDGQTDERLGLGDPCQIGEGLCSSAGVLVCTVEGGVECNAQAPEGVPETCDGLDNDCDRRVDEGFEGVGEICLVGQGACSRTGENVCTGDGLSVTCSVTPGEPNEERCDDQDNDCDGQFNEGFDDLGTRCSAGQGACERFGRQECSADGLSTLCPAEAAPGGAESCNLFDDDCDGQVDEVYANLGAPCVIGVGQCANEGTFRCTADEQETVCDAEEGEPADEVCDQIDNDCDGRVDEDHDQTCGLRAIGLAAASYETCAITPNGSARCWGDAEGPAPAGNFNRVWSGDNFHCALDVEGEAQCWGARSNGRLNPPEDTFISMALGLSGHGCAITDAGVTRCWGRDSAGETQPPDVALSQVSAGMEFSCGLRVDTGTPTCWGNPDFNVLMAPDVVVVGLDSGVSATCGIEPNTEGLLCWGEDLAGQLDAPAGRFTAVSVGGYFACAINDESAIRCWGLDQFEQLEPPAGEFVSVTVGASHACALTQGGVVRCWGAGVPGSGAAFPHLGQASPP